MTARLLLGEPIAAAIREETGVSARATRAARGRAPALAVVAADDESARIYAERIRKDGAASGIDVRVEALAASATTDHAAAAVRRLAADASVDAVLLQTPLPAGVDGARVAEEIPPTKDVDGASLASFGAAALGRAGAWLPATAAAVLEILARSGVAIAGARALVLGRSATVGRPAALGLIARDATVTVAHSRTRDAAALAREADILVVAIGKPALVEASWIRPGATVIDVGVHRVTDAARALSLFAGDAARLAAFETKGSALVGDCHPSIASVAGACTPVPGGVGPVTSAILLSHVAKAARGGA